MKMFKKNNGIMDYSTMAVVVIILTAVTVVVILSFRSIREGGQKEIYGTDIAKILEGFGLEMGLEDREPVGEEITDPTDLTESKTYYLGGDISCSGTCIEIKADDVTLNGNGKTIESDEEGIYIRDQTGITLENLMVENSGGDGGIHAWNSDDITIKDSTISSNSADGIEFFDTENSVIKGNTINGNSGAGIRLAGWSPGSNDNTVKGNTVNNNGIGIRVRDESSDNTINNNEICGNSAYDLWVGSSTSGNSGSNVCSASNSDIGSGNSVDCGGGSC